MDCAEERETLSGHVFNHLDTMFVEVINCLWRMDSSTLCVSGVKYAREAVICLSLVMDLSHLHTTPEWN